MITNIAKTSAKAKTHTVTHSGGTEFTVISGGSGSKYTVQLTKTPSCTCHWGRYRRKNQSSGCSHVQAAAIHWGKVKGYRVTVRAESDNNKKLKRKTVAVGDGIALTMRRVAA